MVKSGLRAAVFLLIQGLRAAVFLLIHGLRTDVFLLIQGLRTDLACYLISVLVALLHRRYTCQLLYVIARTRPRKSRKMSPASRVAEVLLLGVGRLPDRAAACLL